MIDASVAQLKNRHIASTFGILLITFFIFNLILKDCQNILGLVAANTLIANTYVWNLITSCFYETNLIKLLLDLIGLWIVTDGISYVPVDQFGLYLILSIIACTTGTSAISFIRFFASADEIMLIEPQYGFSGVFFTLSMFARQQKKSAAIHSSLPHLTYDNLPFFVITIQTVLRLAR